LWLAGAQKGLSEKAKKAIAHAPGGLFVSGISGFEIGVKAARGAITLPLPAEAWVEKALELHGIIEIPVTCTLGVQAAMLPPIHRDPCDRIIVATALVYGLTVLTKDAVIPRYPDVRVLW
jgi:PIN domain nuclease of toxin-antitoxin system